MARKWGVSSILLVVAVALFLLAAFGASIQGVEVVPLGLAALAGAMFVR